MGSRPSKLHLGAEHQLDSSAHLVVGQEFTAIELVQAFFYLLSEPYVTVNIVFDELLDVFLRAAVVGFRSPVNPRLQIRISVYFHVGRSSNENCWRNVKALAKLFHLLPVELSFFFEDQGHDTLAPPNRPQGLFVEVHWQPSIPLAPRRPRPFRW
jgi:hypothetical protein